MRKLWEILYDGWELLNDGYIPEAKKKFKEVLKKDPKYIDAINGLGCIALEQGKLTEAEKLYKKAYRLTIEEFEGKLPKKIEWGELLNRPYLRAMHGLGLTLWGLDKKDEALEIFRMMLKLNPKDNQGIRFIISAMKAGETWEAFMEEEKEEKIIDELIKGEEMRKVEIDLSELIYAFNSCRIGYEHYLDIVTGEILYTCDELMDTEEIEKIYERIEREPGRYLAIPTDSSREGYRDMEAFTDTVKDENLRDKLRIALNGRGAFRRFKDVLLDYLEYRERWFKFKEERTKSRINEWLQKNKIELIEKKYD